MIATNREKVAEESLRLQSDQVRAAMAHPYTWVRKFTKTYNEHWVKEGRPSPYEPFPDWPYFKHVFDIFLLERISWWEKSRDMMMTWAAVAYFTHAAQGTPQCGVLFQCQKEKKVKQLIRYAKYLYRNQPDWLRDAYPLAGPIDRQSAFELNFAHGGSIIGVPGGADQVRSYHPWGYLNDESSFQPEAGECYNEALAAVAGTIIFNSSAGPGWYSDARHDAVLNQEE